MNTYYECMHSTVLPVCSYQLTYNSTLLPGDLMPTYNTLLPGYLMPTYNNTVLPGYLRPTYNTLLPGDFMPTYVQHIATRGPYANLQHIATRVPYANLQHIATRVSGFSGDLSAVTNMLNLFCPVCSLI